MELDFNQYSKQELVDFMNQVFSDDYKVDMYLVLTERLAKLSQQISTLEDIDLNSKDSKLALDLILDLAEKGAKITESLDKIRSSFSSNLLDKKKSNSARNSSVEAMIKKIAKVK
jgi:Mg2+ and Co2+ transporter CorA